MSHVAAIAPEPRRGPAIWRTPLRKITLRRLFGGGRLADAGRLPRYIASAALGAAAIWAPITGYLGTAPLSYTSELSLILPGSGASATVNLADIGQASSYANSAFASNSISPTETYKRLLGADRILAAAADSLGQDLRGMGRPRVDLVDQTGLIRVQMTGPSPEGARARAEAVLGAFFSEIDALRADERDVRETGGLNAIEDYRMSVAQTRDTIAALQRETGLVSFDQYERLVAANDALRARVETLAFTVAQRAAAVDALSAALGIAPAQAALTLKLYADADYTAMLDEIAAQTALLAEADAHFGARHPKVTAARAAVAAGEKAAEALAMRITGLDAASAGQLDLAAPGARADLLAQLVREDAAWRGTRIEHAAMSARLANETGRLARLAPAAARLEDMQRDFAVAEAVFASAIARRQSSKSDIYASYPLVQVLENPSLPDRPTSPNRKLALAAGIAGTLMMLMGLSLGWIRLALITRLLTMPSERKP
ncbi:MAG: hypothetical protein NXH82_07135 [Rhodobacteraceae bacterium]|nr:hypothetical protein [Paracoccaceae bacterium]